MIPYLYSPKSNGYMKFELISEFKPTGDQPQAIKELVNGIISNEK